MCITELDPGGAERCLVEIATRLDRSQFEPVVYCLGPRPASNPSSLADRLEAAGVKVHCFGARWRLGLPLLLARLRRRIETDRPAIVQNFLFHANVAGTLAARLARVPHVLTGIRVAEQAQLWHVAAIRWVDRWVERHVCVSQAVRDFSAREGGLPSEKLVVIPNGVDVERFAAAQPIALSQLGIAPSRRLIAFIGRLEAQKGLEVFLEQSRLVFEELPDHDLIVVGEGPQRGQLEAIATELNVRKRVHFVGYRNDVPEILKACQLVVVPSRWEGMSNVVLEAMAAERPVVATLVEGITEQLGPQVEMQTVGRDGERFAERVVALARAEELCHTLGRANQHRVAEHFGLQAMIAAYGELYRSLLDQRR
jgi:glycosyltransferase involved in cell wall biosynthesis